MEARKALKAGGNLGKRHAFCHFVHNLKGAMSIPTDPLYCLVYSTSYVKGVEPDHFDTSNNPVGMCMQHSVSRATLQFMNTNSELYKQYSGSQLILPHGAQYHK